MGQAEALVLDFIARVYDALGWPGVVALMAIESACIPLPSELVMPLAGWMLVESKGLGIQFVVLAGFYGAVGNVLGSLAAYWVGLKGGRPLLDRYGRYLLIAHSDLERAERWFQRYGEWAVFFSRLLPVVRTFISLPAGIARMHLGRFVLYTFIGSFPWSLGLAYGGYLLGENWEKLRAVMRPFDIPVVVAILLLVGLYVWHHVRRYRAQTGQRETPAGK